MPWRCHLLSSCRLSPQILWIMACQLSQALDANRFVVVGMCLALAGPGSWWKIRQHCSRHFFNNDSMFSTSSSLTDTLREIKMSPMYMLEPSNNENFVPEKSLRTWNTVISNPQYRVCLRCEPGTSQKSRCTQSNYILDVLINELMPNITQILQSWY